MKKFVGVVTALSLLMFLMPSVTMAGGNGNHHQGGGDYDREVRVDNHNSARVMNFVGSSSNTGGNWAGGSEGGEGGNGGDIDVESDDDDAEVEKVGTGNGGNGGTSGLGGFVQTGNATTDTEVMTMANSNRTLVGDDCGCEGRGDVTVRISNTNRAHVFNAVGSSANTGYNEADGSYGGDGGNGGDIEVDGDDEAEVEHAGTGNGGHAGNGGEGGTVLTGNAHTNTSVVTVVNRNVTRVR